MSRIHRASKYGKEQHVIAPCMLAYVVYACVIECTADDGGWVAVRWSNCCEPSSVDLAWSICDMVPLL